MPKRKYNEDEAYLMAWKQKLQKVNTQRADLQQKLMAIFDSNENVYARRANFNQLKKELLSDDHGQGWTWSPHFDWLWNIVSFFLPASWSNPVPGSRLRKALSVPPTIPEFKELTLRDYEDLREFELNDDGLYETALFSEPHKALAHIKYQLNTTSASDKIESLLENVHALKYRMEPNLYQHVVDTLYQNHTAQTTNYFYHLYQQDNYEVPYSQDFVELHLLARALINKIVKSTDNFYTHNFYGQYLIILLCLQTPEIKKLMPEAQRNSMQQALKNWDLNDFTQVYDQCNQSLHTILYERLDSQELQNRKAKKLLSGQGENDDLPLQMIKDVYAVFYVNPHPLLMHVARQYTELLLEDYNQQSKDETWKPGHNGFETINFMTTMILRTEPIKQLSSYQNQTELLNPMGYTPTIPHSMKLAEKFATELSLAYSIGENFLLDTAQQLRCNYKKHFTAEVNEWIFSRFANLHKEAIPGLKHVLVDTKIYDPDDFFLLETPQVDSDPQSLLTTMKEQISNAKRYRSVLDSTNENHSIQQALIAVSQILKSPRLESSHLDQLFNDLFFSFNRQYITPELKTNLQSMIWKAQAKLVRWKESDFSDIHETSDAPLSQADLHRLMAFNTHSNEYHSNFTQENEASKMAVYFFVQYLKSPDCIKEEAQDMLSLLEAYIAPQQFALWYNELKESKSSIHPGKSGIFSVKPMTTPSFDPLTQDLNP